MKITDIVPGKIYATALSTVGFDKERPYRYGGGKIGTAKNVSDGTFAAPIRVIAVGKFRWQQQGACAKGIIDDHFTTTVHAEVLDVPHDVRRANLADPNKIPGMAGSPIKPTSKRLKWREVIVAPNAIVMPWESFTTRYEEDRIAKLEMSAYAERHQELTQQMKGRVARAAQEKFTETAITDRPQVQFYMSGSKKPYVVATAARSFDLDDLLDDEGRKLRDEILALEERMSCRPHQRLIRR